ncbi:hypothetical protein NUACC21_21770 [Scytonema sp. NUACC21]
MKVQISLLRGRNTVDKVTLAMEHSICQKKLIGFLALFNFSEPKNFHNEGGDAVE